MVAIYKLIEISCRKMHIIRWVHQNKVSSSLSKKKDCLPIAQTIAEEK